MTPGPRARWPVAVPVGSILAGVLVPVGLFAIAAVWLGDGNGPTLDPESGWWRVVDAGIVAWVSLGFATIVLAFGNVVRSGDARRAAGQVADVTVERVLRNDAALARSAAVIDGLAAALFLFVMFVAFGR